MGPDRGAEGERRDRLAGGTADNFEPLPKSAGGRGRRLDIDLTYRPGADLPVSELERIRAAGRIVWSDALAGWLVSSYEDVKTVLGSPQKFTLEGTPIAESFGEQAMLVTDTALHHTMRSVWEKHVSASAMAARANGVRRILLKLLEPVRAQLNAGETVDLTVLFEDFTAAGIIWLMGMPADRAEDLKRWNRLLSEAPVLAMQKGSPEYERHFATRTEVYEFLFREMDDRRTRLAAGEQLDDMVSLMVAAEARAGLTRAQVSDNLLNFFTGAIDTTSKWMGNMLVALHGRRDVLGRVRADHNLLPALIEEVMRFDTVPQLLLRRVRRDGTELAGQVLRANDRVYVLPGAANRDREVFEWPDTFDIGRERNPHLGFGIGMHHCLGKNVSRVETLALAEALLDVLPNIEIVDCDYGASWALWGPVGLHLRLRSK